MLITYCVLPYLLLFPIIKISPENCSCNLLMDSPRLWQDNTYHTSQKPQISKIVHMQFFFFFFIFFF